MLSFQMNIDYRSIEKTLSDIHKKALPKAAAGFLNGIAFEARKQLIDHTAEAFDGHVKFTDRAWIVNKARSEKGSSMYAEVKSLPAQAKYLKFQIDGGIRRAGDAGSGPKDLFVFGAKTNKSGNIRKGYVSELSRKNREEKTARKSLRSQREAAKMAGMDTSPFAYFRVHKNRPGMFFGDIGGTLGYWQRPKRSKAAHKRRNGVISVVHTEKMKPLLSVSDTARYKPRYQYQEQINKAMRVKGASSSFNDEFSRQFAIK